MKKWIKAGTIIFLCLFLCLIPKSTTYGEDNKVCIRVMVPLMNDSGFVSYEDGIFSGYYIDYLTEIAKYTGWDYEFIPVENYDELDMVCESGNYDIMTGIIYSEEYDEMYFEYPKRTVGAKRYVFAVPKDSELIADREYSYLRGVRIGIAGNTGITELEERFEDFCHMYGISCIRDSKEEYAKGVNFIHIDPSVWNEKIRNGEIDGILSSDAFCLSQGMHAITTFGLDQIYFVSPNGRVEITDQMNDALEKIANFDPEFNDRLYDKYFHENTSYRVPFSSSETEYIEQGHTWKVGMPENYAPYSYMNHDGEPAGMITKVLNMVSGQTGGKLQFEYVFYERIQDVKEAVRNGDCDISGVSMYSLLLKRDSSERRSMSFYTDSFVYYKNDNTSADMANQSAIMPHLPEELLASIGIEEEWIDGGEAANCLEQIENGKNSYTVMLSQVGDYYKSYYGFADLDSYPVTDGEVMFCFAYSPDMGQMSISIIDKCLLGIGEETLDSYVKEVTLFEHKSHTLGEYIKQHIEFFALLLAGILLIICTLLIVIIINITHSSRKVHALLYRDDITGGISYKKFKEEAEKICRSPAKKLMLYINISSFKYINDVFGYKQGNEVLQEVHDFIEDHIKGVLFARIYADRFVILLPYKDQDEVKKQVQEKLETFEGICRDKFPSFNIWIKVGGYVLKEGDDIQRAVNFANYAVDEIRKTSENTCNFYDKTMHEHVLMQKEIEKDMWGALEHEEFVPYYQPKYNIETKELIGAEALVRWNHPKKGMLSPGVFIPVFETNHFIIQVDFYIFECVCRFIKSLMAEGKKLFPISSNFSRLHLNRPDFVERLMQIVNRYQIPTEFLEIEITETVATEDIELLLEAVKQLKANRFLVSIDDFGSGYSSIQLLYKLPIDVLKLDKAFVDNEDVSELEAELVDSIISVSLKNGIQVICEGVETQEQEEFVRKHNCIYVQGFLYSRPVPDGDFRELLSK